MTSSQDLAVQPISDALQGQNLDLVVSGSIGAVESVRLLRALRRLGADVYPWLTKGGAQFTTEMSLAWAAARPCIREFSGDASHIALRDACIVAPASASMIAKLAGGLTDSPASALIASYLGQKKPVLLIANMHDSLLESPFVAANLERLAPFCTILTARQEEGKQKFPEPQTLADEIAHVLKRRSLLSADQRTAPKILLTMGTTRGYIDSVRYISNYSSGALGTEIAHEFYRRGFAVHVVAGPSAIMPRSYTKLHQVETNAAMSRAVQAEETPDLAAAIFAASVLDFVPDQTRSGKIRSDEKLEVNFVKTPKIIAEVQQKLRMKVAFKLETSWDSNSSALAEKYLDRYQLSHLVMNVKDEVDEKRHRALVFQDAKNKPEELRGKRDVATYLAKEATRLLFPTPT